MNGSARSKQTQTGAADAPARDLRAEVQPGDLSLSLANALGQADEVMRRAHDALDAARAVEQQMRIMDDRARAMAAASSSVTWLTTGDGLMEDAPNWRAFTGQTVEQARGWGWLAATHPDDRERVIAGWQVALGQQLPYTDEFRVRRSDGAYLDFLTQAAPIYEDDGSVREWVGVCIDITQRKRLERDLLASEQKYRTTFEQAATGIAHIAPDGRIVLVNDQFCRLLGYEREELLALTISAITHADDVARDAAAMRDLLENRSATYTMERRYWRRDGGLVWTSMTGSLVRDSDGQPLYFISVSEDVSERKRLEQGLADNVAQLEAIFEAIGDAVFVYDAYGQPVRTNAASHGIYGADPGQSYLSLPREERRTRIPAYDLEGRLLEAERRPAARALRGEVFRGNDAQDVRMRTADGHLRDLNFTGAPIRSGRRITGAVVVARDVTERRRLERVALEAERQAAARASELEAALEAMSDGVALYDADGRLLRMNRAANLYLASAAPVGDAAESAQPHDALIQRLLSGRDRQDEQDKQVARGSTDDEASVRHEEVRAVGQDGHERDLSLTGATIRDSAGHVIGAVVVARDVTERNRLEQQRKDMLQTVGHDLVSPLLAARIYVRQRKRLHDAQAVAHDERDAQALSALEHSLGRIERLVGDLQLAARIELGMLQLTCARTDLAALGYAEAELAVTATGRQIHVEAPDQPVIAEVDASRIGQTLANLLGNAHKYSPRDCSIWLALQVGDGRARISVRDEGCGIPPAEQERIWEQFHQVKDNIPMAGNGGGLGLGLYIARHVVEAHGGEIGVTSEVGHGSTFWFTLPLVTSLE
jgi:PAS domain S-box-containing protein